MEELYGYKEDFYRSYRETRSNDFENDLSSLSKSNYLPSTIQKNTNEFSSMNTINDYQAALKAHVIHFHQENIPNPIIDIQLQNFETGKILDNYPDDLSMLNDHKINYCQNCKTNINLYFCEICKYNICDQCCFGCIYKSHSLIDLRDESKIIENYKIEIRNIISKLFIKQKETKDDQIEKKIRIYNNIMDNEYGINNEIGEYPIDYPNSIELIETIIEKNYINHYHYNNIKKCFKYIKEIYDKTRLNNNDENIYENLTISSNINNYEEEKESINEINLNINENIEENQENINDINITINENIKENQGSSLFESNNIANIKKLNKIMKNIIIKERKLKIIYFNLD